MLPLVLLLAASLPQDDAPLLVDPAVLFAPEVVDHRASQSPVKNQGDRGTCAAFALCGLLETFPGVPTDLNEQVLFATVKLLEQDVDTWLRAIEGPEAALTLDEGNAFDAYLPLFGLVGTCHEDVWPYDPRVAVAGDDVPEHLRRYLEYARIGPEQLRALRDGAGKWGFRAADAELLTRDTVRDVARLKQELRSGTLAIPVGYRVHAPNWSRIDEVGAVTAEGSALGPGQRAAVHPGMLHVFAPKPDDGAVPAWMPYEAARDALRAETKDLAQEVLEERWIRGLPHPETEYGGHAVLLVGFGEDGFLAKNSWGTDWGVGGYFVIPYDYHRMYANGGVILRRAKLRNPELSPFEQTKRIREAVCRLKAQPRPGEGGEPVLELSTWFADDRDPNVEVVEYTVETKGLGDAEWSVLERRAVLAGGPEERRGAPLVLSGQDLARLRFSGAHRVRVRYGCNVLDPARPSSAQFPAKHTFTGLPRDLRRAVDLRPVD